MPNSALESNGGLADTLSIVFRGTPGQGAARHCDSFTPFQLARLVAVRGQRTVSQRLTTQVLSDSSAKGYPILT